MNKKLRNSLIVAAMLFSGIIGYNANDFKSNYTNSAPQTTVSASSILYQAIRENNLKMLHTVGNKSAKQANYEYALTVAGREGYTNANSLHESNEPYLPKKFLKKHMIYHPDKYGNYWSWFTDHTAIANDLFDMTNINSNNGGHMGSTNGGPYAGGLNSYRPKRYVHIFQNSDDSGIVAEEKVLRNHGVHSGVNFLFYKIH